MTRRFTPLYAVAAALLIVGCRAGGIEPIDHQPIAKLTEAIKSSGHERIAQGLQGVLAKDSKTGELFTTRSPLMLTTNKQTGEWTVSVIHDKIVGSTLLIGKNLRRPPPGENFNLPTFDRAKAEATFPKLKDCAPAYYADKVRYYREKYAEDRMFTGEVILTTDAQFNDAMKPAFADIFVDLKTGNFAVVVVDQYGACGIIAAGGTFTEKA